MYIDVPAGPGLDGQLPINWQQFSDNDRVLNVDY